jgi:hypothetical protein
LNSFGNLTFPSARGFASPGRRTENSPAMTPLDDPNKTRGAVPDAASYFC